MPSWHLCQFGIIPSRHKIVYCAAMAKEPYPSETADRYIVRFPDGMRDRIREEADKNGRSMNAEIIARLEQTFSGGPNLLGEPDAYGRQLADSTRSLLEALETVRSEVRTTTLLTRFVIESALENGGKIPDDLLPRARALVTQEIQYRPEKSEDK